MIGIKTSATAVGEKKKKKSRTSKKKGETILGGGHEEGSTTKIKDDNDDADADGHTHKIMTFVLRILLTQLTHTRS